MSRSLTKITRLGVLSREIRSDYESLQQLVERTRRSCDEVVAETILLGTKLAEAKKLVRHGNWSEWLARHCPQIAETTARNYMRLANRQHVADLKECKSLRQAYIAVGIIPVDGESTPAVEVSQPFLQLEQAANGVAADATQPVVEAVVVEPVIEQNEPLAVVVADTPITRVRGRVSDLMQCLKPLDVPNRKRVAVHLKPLVIFYHRFGK